MKKCKNYLPTIHGFARWSDETPNLTQICTWSIFCQDAIFLMNDGENESNCDPQKKIMFMSETEEVAFVERSGDAQM